MKVILNHDAGVHRNPGYGGYGYTIRRPNSERFLVEGWGPLWWMTNNEAEYWALFHGLKECAALGVTMVEARSDSRLVVMQVSGKWKVKHDTTKRMLKEVNALIHGFESFAISWIPREQNIVADALATTGVKEAVVQQLAAPSRQSFSQLDILSETV